MKKSAKHLIRTFEVIGYYTRHLHFYLPALAIPLLLLLPAAITVYHAPHTDSIPQQVLASLLPVLFFLMPVLLFYRNIKLYFYLLLPLIILSPLLIFCLVFYGIRPQFELIVLVFQTNMDEIKEATEGYTLYFMPFALAYVALYLYAIRKVPLRKIPLGAAIGISSFSVCLAYGVIFYEKDLFTKPISKIDKYDLLRVSYYPASLLGGSLEAYSFLAKNKLSIPEHFSFHAQKLDTLPQREIYVFIIGESSRWDHWQLNGYQRPTSPRLARQQNLLSFSDVVAGSNLTSLSVPQMITRATPDSMDLQFSEGNIMSAFKEAGFRTAWLSNQTDQEIFWSGAINLHARTADLASFSPSRSPNFEYDNFFDERLLPQLEGMLAGSDQKLFIVLHTLGNHWIYSRRYPPQFDHFKPSGYGSSISPPTEEKKKAIINSYDNSIRYADYIIDSVINTVKKHAAVAAVTFLADHGEDLFDQSAASIDFHLNPSAQTLRVPLFIWTSDQYQQAYPQKINALEQHLQAKVGTENTFYTLLDMANIRIKQADSTKSLVHPAFINSTQRYYDNKFRAAYYFNTPPLQ